MFSWLKKYFYPHKGNDHHPHLLRTEVSAFILSLIFFSEVVFLFSILVVLPNTNFLATILPNVLVDSTNIERQKMSENQLSINPILQQAAQAKANDMTTKGYFAHTSPEGVSPWYWLSQVGYKYSYAGENLAVNFSDSQDLHNAWMNSPGHKANIINQNYTEIGMATSQGTYKGQEATFVVQYFGRPSSPWKTTMVAPSPPINKTAIPSSNPTNAIKAPSPSPSIMPTPSRLVESEMIVVEDELSSDQFQTIPVAVTGYSSFKDNILTNPKSLFTATLSVVLMAFITALSMSLLSQNGVLKTRAIFNGVVALAVIIAVISLNQYVSTMNASIF